MLKRKPVVFDAAYYELPLRTKAWLLLSERYVRDACVVFIAFVVLTVFFIAWGSLNAGAISDRAINAALEAISFSLVPFYCLVVAGLFGLLLVLIGEPLYGEKSVRGWVYNRVAIPLLGFGVEIQAASLGGMTGWEIGFKAFYDHDTDLVVTDFYWAGVYAIPVFLGLIAFAKGMVSPPDDGKEKPYQTRRFDAILLGVAFLSSAVYGILKVQLA